MDSEATFNLFSFLLRGHFDAKWLSALQYRHRWLSRWYWRWASVRGSRFLEVLSTWERSMGPGAVPEAVLEEEAAAEVGTEGVGLLGAWRSRARLSNLIL